jgi:hypothetical protein
MPEEQGIKFARWICFVVLVPLVVDPAALIIAGLEGRRGTLRQAALELGDLLFLVVALLASSILDRDPVAVLSYL